MQLQGGGKCECSSRKLNKRGGRGIRPQTSGEKLQPSTFGPCVKVYISAASGLRHKPATMSMSAAINNQESSNRRKKQ